MRRPHCTSRYLRVHGYMRYENLRVVWGLSSLKSEVSEIFIIVLASLDGSITGNAV